MIWTSRQRGALIVVIAGLLVYLGVTYSRNPVYVNDPQTAEGSRASQLPNGVDPNTADVGTLAAIPVMGKALAERIVADRDAYSEANPGKVPYARLDDLLRVKGIGPATLSRLEPYLIFPQEDRPTTQP
ncbi:MAG TPA: helix-hairpin-helix domain-containing protein [Tepidisphaeraceae bacterium]|nr:helix-hairpin-helix domain-containing protein [Tepidisphaeraceae bacterium]